jgi:hypothetical protein
LNYTDAASRAASTVGLNMLVVLTGELLSLNPPTDREVERVGE